MKLELIRKGMEKLWKETFGDSDEYIRLVFDEYFNPATIAYHADGSAVVSALLGVPYEFRGQEGRPSLKGLYLCGLATDQTTRRKGMMSRLLEQINAKARAAGFDFTFLIPSSEKNASFYAERRFHNAFYKIRQRYVHDHIFHLEEGLEDASFYKFDGGELDTLVDFLSRYEKSDCCPPSEADKSVISYELIHSQSDWRGVLRESIISGEAVYIARQDGEIRGVAFTASGNRQLEVRRLLVSERKYCNFLLKGIRETMSQDTLVVLEDVCRCEKSTQLWRPFYIQNNPLNAEYEDISEVRAPFSPSGLAHPYGMIRLLDVHRLIAKIQDCDPASYEDFSESDLINMLLRRPLPGGADPLGSLLDIPELNLSISLLLE